MPLDLSQRSDALALFDGLVCAAVYDEHTLEQLWASRIFQELTGQWDPDREDPGYTEKCIQRILDAEQENYPNSPLLGNGVKLMGEGFERAKEFGHYVQVFWFLNREAKLLRCHAVCKYVEGLGYSIQIAPMEDATGSAWTYYNIEKRKFSTDFGRDVLDWEDLALYELILEGCSESTCAEQLGIPVQRVKYRIKRWCEIMGITNGIQGIRQQYMGVTSDYTIPHMGTVVHGNCELLVTVLPADR